MTDMEDYSDRVFKGLEPENDDDKRVQYLQEAFALPPEKQTYANVMALAKAHGAYPADKAADDFFKKQKESFAHIKLLREHTKAGQEEETFNSLFPSQEQRSYQGLPPDFQVPNLDPTLVEPPQGEIFPPMSTEDIGGGDVPPQVQTPTRGLVSTVGPTPTGVPEDVQLAAKAEALGIPVSLLSKFVTPPKTDTNITEVELARIAVSDPNPLKRDEAKQALTLLRQNTAKPLDLGDYRESKSMELHGKRFIELDQKQQSSINKLTEDYNVRIAGAQAGARTTKSIEAQRDEPLGVKAGLYMDENGNFADPKLTENEAIKKGMIPVNQSRIDSVKFAKGSLNYLRSYLKLVPKLLVKKSDNDVADAAKIQANRLLLAGKRTAGNPDAQMFDALSAYIVQLARATGDSGNIAVAERLITLSALPTTGDSQESAIAKLHQAEEILQGHIKSSGIPFSGSIFSNEKALSKKEMDDLAPKFEAAVDKYIASGLSEADAIVKAQKDFSIIQKDKKIYRMKK